MGEKQVYEVTCLDGSLARYHVDHEKEEVYLETGGLHPETGEPLLRFASRNVAPFPRLAPEALEEFAATPVEELTAEFGPAAYDAFGEENAALTEPSIVGDLEHVASDEDLAAHESGFEFEATPVAEEGTDEE